MSLSCPVSCRSKFTDFMQQHTWAPQGWSRDFTLIIFGNTGRWQDITCQVIVQPGKALPQMATPVSVPGSKTSRGEGHTVHLGSVNSTHWANVLPGAVWGPSGKSSDNRTPSWLSWAVTGNPLMAWNSGPSNKPVFQYAFLLVRSIKIQGKVQVLSISL